MLISFCSYQALTRYLSGCLHSIDICIVFLKLLLKCISPLRLIYIAVFWSILLYYTFIYFIYWIYSAQALTELWLCIAVKSIPGFLILALLLYWFSCMTLQLAASVFVSLLRLMMRVMVSFTSLYMCKAVRILIQFSSSCSVVSPTLADPCIAAHQAYPSIW